MKTSWLVAGCCFVLFSSAAGAQMKHVADEELLKAMEGAAPPEIVAHATVMNMTPDGKMKTVREGSNGWTCMDPGNAPMCADAGGMEWAKAYMAKGKAPQTLGFIYMLKGDAGISNTDPYGMTETPDNNWVAKADPNKPFVMWPGTPYEHLMLPVK